MNRLATETSPYLRQHAANPVDWYPWGEEALARAREEDKPILLSVGYSACHWCHVMAHESFEDAAVAETMNRHFVNVKVDREERPDVDSIYMQAVQALTGRGGWPMTVFLDPDGRPFFGGTYFPKEPRQGMPGFVQVMETVSDAWSDRRDELLTQAGKLRDAIARTASFAGVSAGTTAAPSAYDRGVLDEATEATRSQFDRRFGGFGRAPKFPQAMTLDFLLAAWLRTGSTETLQVATHTLDQMAAGGMYDQVGGGFHRYSVDEYWLVPHFEKMLYDQALLVRAYLHGFLATGEERYRRVVEETVGYVLRDLRDARGGFFSAEDADSEGVEGRFYVWSAEEVRAVCEGDAQDVIEFFGVTEGGNFEGANILHAVDPTASRPGGVEQALPRLREARERRPRPGLDDKVLTAWNALFLRSLTEAAVALERPDWMEAARGNASFLLAELRRGDGRLLRSWQDGTARLLGYAEDYAALLEALLTLAELDDVGWLTDARELADHMRDLFADEDGDGLFTTGRDAEPLIVRPKDVEDNAVPSENSLAANAFLRLAVLTGDDRYDAAARAWLDRVAPFVTQYPTAFAYLLGALERSLVPPLEIAIVGDADDPRTRALHRVLDGRLLTNAVMARATPGVDDAATPLLAGRTDTGGQPTAYVCEHYACREPATSPSELAAHVDAALAARRGAERPSG